MPGNIEKFDLLCRLSGRDGRASTCVLVFDRKREFLERNRAQAVQTSLASVKAIVQEVFHKNEAKFPTGTFSLIADARQILAFDIYSADLSLAYSILDTSLECIKLIGRQYAACQLEVVPGHESVLRADRTPAGLAIVKHSARISETGLFDLDIIRAAHTERLPDFTELTAKINSLESHGHIKVYPRKSLLIFRLDRVPKPGAETDAVARFVHEQLLRKHEAKRREKRLLRDALLGNSCISAAVAKHFGSQLPDGKARCGRCSSCLDGTPVKTRIFPPRDVDLSMVEAILRELPDEDNPRFLARVATGDYSPRINYRNVRRLPVFGSMADCKFEVSGVSSDGSRMATQN